MAEIVIDTKPNNQSQLATDPRFQQQKKPFFTMLKQQKGWLWLIPALILIFVFTVYPIINTLISAFKNGYEGIGNSFDGVGIQNFKSAVQDSYFVGCLINTIIFAFISVPLSTVLALLISIGLSSIKRLQSAYQTIFFLPYLTNALAMGAVFAIIFQVVGTRSNTETWGLFNIIFGTQNHWVDTQASIWSMRFVVIVYEVWSGLPFKILILFGALQNVNKQYYDAAKIDGASKPTTIWRITVPLISPMISYLLITGFIGGFKSYTAIVGIFGPQMGPNNDYEVGTIVGLIYRYIETAQTGVASAASLILFALIMIFTGINMLISKKRVHY